MVSDCDEEELYIRKRFIEESLNMPYHWLSVYRKSSICELHEYGSYFLWHIKIEGEILFSNSSFLSDILESLPPYRKTIDNLYEYRQICMDIKKSVLIDACTIEYELSILASIIRNTCISFCYLNNQYDFGKFSAVRKTLGSMDGEIPFTLQEFELLYSFRIAETRKLNIGQDIHDIITVDYALNWVEKAVYLIDMILSKERGGIIDE